MGLILKRMKFWGNKGSRVCETLFDTGATASFVRKDVAEAMGDIRTAPFPLSFKLGDNSVMEVNQTTELYLRLNGHNIWHSFLVVPDLPYEVILGADFFQRWKVKLDPVTEEFVLDEKALEILLV